MSILDAFIMPTQVTIMARSSSITNSFVNGIIPCIAPTEDAIIAALSLLDMDESTVACAYCGDPMTEWDHLNPLVRNKRPTGYISEIHNLVPSCGKCNQSKGNKPWREWIVSEAKKSPRSRGVPDLNKRIARLEAYERTFKPVKLDFESIVDSELWNTHWENLEHLHDMMQQCQAHSDLVKQAIADSAAQESSEPKPPRVAQVQRSSIKDCELSREHQAKLQRDKYTDRSDTAYQLPTDLRDVDELANKGFVSRCLAYLESHSASLKADLETLCSKKECKSAFNHDQALLKQVDDVANQARARKDDNGHPRYYATPITIHGRLYLVSSEWYGLGKTGRDNRTPFLEWVLSR